MAATGHDVHAVADYRRLRHFGITTVREGIRWHRIEIAPGRYDFSCELSRIRAARDEGIAVIWDLCHFGWPDDLDVFAPAFVSRLAMLARAFAELLERENVGVPFYTPVNEISFVAWAGGRAGYLNPFRQRRGSDLKAQLVRAALASIDAVWSVDERARIVHAEPLIHIAAHPERPHERRVVLRHRKAQFEAWDMIAGRRLPELGGAPRYLDIVGVNYYPRNQWIHRGRTLVPRDELYRPFREMLAEVHTRYGRPLFVAETGAEDSARGDWLRYIGGETRAAIAAEIPVEGICLYPILNHPGWDDDRHCHNGMWDYHDDTGDRQSHAPLAEELRRQQQLIGVMRQPPG